MRKHRNITSIATFRNGNGHINMSATVKLSVPEKGEVVFHYRGVDLANQRAVSRRIDVGEGYTMQTLNANRASRVKHEDM